MKSLKQYFYESDWSYDDEDDQFENPLSEHDRFACNRYIDLYAKLLETIEKLNKLAMPIYKKVNKDTGEFRKIIDKDKQAIALGKQCRKLVNKIYDTATGIEDDYLRTRLMELVEVPIGHEYDVEIPSGYTIDGEFPTVSIKDLKKAIDDYEETGEEIYLEG